MTCYVHIGLPKTGTTSIQEFLFANHAQLKQQGYLYPVSLGGHNHNVLGLPHLNFRGTCRLEDYRLPLEHEITAAGAEHTIISAEGLHNLRSRHVPMIREFREFLERLGLSDFRIVVFLRDAEEMLVSSYSQSLKAGDTTDHLHIHPQRNPFYLNLCDHRTTLENWGTVFGMKNLCVRLYSAENIIHDFLQTVSIAPDAHFRFPDLKLNLNPSLNLMGVELMQRINRMAADAGELHVPVSRCAAHFVSAHLSGLKSSELKFRPPRQILEAYRSYFAASDEWVRATFFPERECLFEKTDLTAYSENSTLTVMRAEYWDRLAELLFDLIKQHIVLSSRLRQLSQTRQKTADNPGST